MKRLPPNFAAQVCDAPPQHVVQRIPRGACAFGGQSVAPLAGACALRTPINSPSPIFRWDLPPGSKEAVVSKTSAFVPLFIDGGCRRRARLRGKQFLW